MAYDQSFDGSLREEVQALRKKVVALETAEVENVKLRKELTKLKVSFQEEKSQLELDFMNQLTGVARENQLQMEELEGRIKECNKVNRVLSEQLQQAPTHAMIEERVQSMDALHRKEIAQIVDSSKLELETTRRHLAHLLTSRDKLAEELEQTKASLQTSQDELKELQNRGSTGSESIQKLLTDAHEENAKLKVQMNTLKAQNTKSFNSSGYEIQILKERLKARDTEINAKIQEITRLETELAKASSPATESEKVSSLEIENARLINNVKRLETEKRDQHGTIERLQGENKELREKCDSLETKTTSLTAALNSQQDQQQTPPNPLGSPQSSSGPRTPGTPGRKTSLIINQWEQNLKNSQHKHSSKDRRRSIGSLPMDETVPVSVAEALREEISDLKEKLEYERNLTLKLQDEVNQSNTATPKTSATPKSQSTVSKIPTFSGRKSIGKIKPISTTPQATPTQISTTTNKTPRTPVLGLVHSFEKKISQNTNQQMADIASCDIHDIDELKEALQFERQQVFELEDELTRQCEINCSLLKEIAAVTNETETSRSRHAIAFQSTSEGDRRVEELKNEIKKLEIELSRAEEAKLSLSAEIDRHDQEHKAEIMRLSKQIDTLKQQVEQADQARSSFEQREKSALTDRREMDRLRLEIKKVQGQLADAHFELDQKSTDYAKLQNKANSLEQEQKNKKLESENRQSQVAQLEADNLSAQHKIAGLNSLVATLQSNLSDSDATKEALKQEKLAASQLDSLVQELKKDLQSAESEIQRLKGEKSKSDQNDQTKIANLSSQVESLTSELEVVTSKLKIVTEERDDLEQRDQVHNSKFDSLRAEINEKVDQFEGIHKADKEEISRLRDQVKSLEEELQSTLSNLQRLQKVLADKERAEETAEELQRKTQNSIDAQVNKYTREITQLRLAEVEAKKKLKAAESKLESVQTKHEGAQKSVEDVQKALSDKDNIIKQLAREKEQLVLSMKDMTSSRRDEIDELQSELVEMSTRAANQAREVQILKIQLDESSYRKEEVDRLRARVRELSEKLASQSMSHMEDERDRELSKENNELRQKLRETAMSLKAAEDKMRDMVVEKGGSSKSMQVLRERNATLKFEVEKLTRKLRKVAGERKQEEAAKGKVAPTKKTKQEQAQDQADRYVYKGKSKVQDSASSSTRFMI